MDPYRVVGGVAVAAFMMIAPQLGVPLMEALPVPHFLPGGEDDKATLARFDLEVGPRVALQTLDKEGNRSHLRVLWVEVEGEKLAQRAQGQGKLKQVSFAAAMPGGLQLGNDTLPVTPGDTLHIEGFEGKWAYAPDGMVGILRMEGSVLAARQGEKGLRPMGTKEEAVAPGWVLSGEPQVLGNVTVRAGRTAFVSLGGATPDGERVEYLTARDARVNGAKLQGTLWGEGALDSVSFVVEAPGTLRGASGEHDLTPGERVDVVDFVGAYVLVGMKEGRARVGLEGYAASVIVSQGGAEPPPSDNKAPVAGFDWAPKSPRSGQSVKFFDRSSDPDGLVARREWRFGDGAVSAEENPSHAFDAPGVYQVVLSVVDNNLVSTSVTQQLTVLNQPPAPSWTHNPERPSSLDTVQFVDGSTDADGRVVAWLWDFGDGASSSEQNPTHRYADDGRYNVTLTAWDEDGATTTLARTLDVRNLAPQARFSFAPVQPLSGQGVRFSDASADPDGRVVAWAWDFGDGTRSAEQHPLHTFLINGPHRVVLTATDDDGAVHAWDSLVDVRNTPPHATFTVAPDPPAEGQPARFLDTSSDPDGRIVERVWSFGDGGASQQPNPEHTYLQGGNVTVALTVKDDDGARTTVMRSFTVNRRPLAAFTALPEAPSTRDDVAFRDASVDADGRVVRWAWSFGDGNASAQQHPVHRYARPGLYTVTLNVTDDHGGVGTLARTLNVTGMGPQAAFDWTPVVPTAGQEATFTDRSSDPDGAIVQRTWTFPDGTTLQGPVVVRRFSAPGSFPVTLLVADADGNSATQTQTVRVNAPPVAAFTFTPTNPSTATDVRFTEASTDADGQVAQWLWDFADGATSTDRHPVHRFEAQGVYDVRLTAVDNDGGRATLTRRVSVGNLPPTAAFEVPTARPVAGEPVAFRDLSVDPDGAVAAWRWNFGDGAESPEQHPTHAFAAPVAYDVRLTVTDDTGRAAATSRTLRVLSAGEKVLRFAVQYPDGQPLNLARADVQAELRDLATGATLSKAGPRTLDAGSDGTATGRFLAGEWAPGDEVVVVVRSLSGGTSAQRAFPMPAGQDLGSLTIPMPLASSIALLPPSRGGSSYTDATEPVRGVLQVKFRDGTLVRGAEVLVTYAWEQRGGAGSVPVEHLQQDHGPAANGLFAFTVPFDAGTDGAGVYLPGVHRIIARAGLLSADGAAASRTFLFEPPGASLVQGL